MSAAEWRTRRLVVNCGISLLRSCATFARRLQSSEILAGVMRRPRQRRRRHHQKALGEGDRLQRLEFVRRHEPYYRVMLAGRLQILADGEEVDAGRTEIVHHLQHFVSFLAETDHDAGL